MVIIGKMCYPPDSAPEVGKRFLSGGELPDYISLKGPYILGATGEGMQSLAIFECDKAKIGEALDAVSNRYARYIGVPGLTYSIHPWFDAAEALKMIGL